MYCERCGKKVGMAGIVLGKCPGCRREFNLKPRVLDIALMLAAFALVPAVAVGLFAAGLHMPTADLGIAVLAAVAFRLLVTYGLVCARALKSDGFTERPSKRAREVGRLISRDEERFAQTEQALQLIPDFKPAQAAGAARPAATKPHKPAAIAPARLHYAQVSADDADGLELLARLVGANLQDAWGVDLAGADLLAWAERHVSPRALAAQMAHGGAEYWLASAGEDDADAPFGLVGLCPHGPEAPKTLDVVALWLDPAHRGQGLSHDLVNFARGQAEGRGLTHLALRVAKSNPLASISAEHLGFKRKGEDERQLTPDVYVKELFYRLDLR